MTTNNPIPIASIAFLRKWQRIHRRLTGSTARRHVYMARILALAGLTPEQVAIVTAHQAQVEQALCCDFVAEHVAATLRPSLFATVILQSLGEGKPMILGDSDGPDNEVEAAMKTIAEGKPTKRKKA